jgi:hypothetical protein
MASLMDFVNRLNAVERGTDTEGNPRYHADCPFCGKPTKPGQNHFYFSAIGFKCWACGEVGHLGKLAQHLAMPKTEHVRIEKKPKPVQNDTHFSDKLIASYTSHPDRYDLWYQYRRLNTQTVDRYSLGVGILPGQYEQRLIMPIKRAGTWVGLRGRRICDGNSPKWLNAKGSRSMFYCPGGYRIGGTLFITENTADCLLVLQMYQEYDAGAPTCGVSSWKDIWSEYIAMRPPALIILAFDADWQTKPQVKAGTMKTLASLRRHGLNVELFDWSKYDTGSDIGEILMRRIDA